MQRTEKGIEFYKNRGYDITYLSDVHDLKKYLEIVTKTKK